MAERIKLNDELKRDLMEPEMLPVSIKVRNREYTLERPFDAGYKSAVWRVRDEFGRKRALKLCTHDDYQDRSYLEELSIATALEPYPEFAHFVDAGLVELPIGDRPSQSFVCFVEEWIDGFTLESFVNEKTDLVTTSLLLAYVKGMCGALSALRNVGLRHDDLHARNVMLARPVPGRIPSEWTIKVVDTGSMKPADSPISKPKDDHRHFVDHLILIWNTVHARKILTVRDRRFLSEASRLLESMLDDEPSIALLEPAQVVNQFDLAYTRADHSAARARFCVDAKGPLRIYFG